MAEMRFFKWIFGLIAGALAILLVILGIQGWFIYKDYSVNWETLEIEHGRESEREKKKQEVEMRKKAEDDLRNLQSKALKGFNPEGKASILSIEAVSHPGFLKDPNCSFTCQDVSTPTLIYPKTIHQQFRAIINDIICLKNGQELEKEHTGESDNYSKQLKRNNTVMYGAPGTGKSVFVEELVHHLYENFGKKVEVEIINLKNEIEALKIQRKDVDKKYPVEQKRNDEQEKIRDQLIDQVRKALDGKEEELSKLENSNITPPIIQIKGEKLKSASGISSNEPDVAQKFLSIVKHYKRKVFGSENSTEPYIVFVEEADQGVDVMGGTGGKKNYLLEEYKTFLSTTEDKVGLAANCQDPNSIIIIATNNFPLIDPAVVRRGRLGRQLNFDWTPEIIKRYGEEGDNNYMFSENQSGWPKINWPKDDPCWQFEGNANYGELYGLCTQFGYAKFKDKFAKNSTNPNLIGVANRVIKSYYDLKYGDRAWFTVKEKELGCLPTGKKITVNGKEEDEKVCNWLLHFLYTFHWFNDRQQIDVFQSIKEIKRYDFGNEFLTREAIWGNYSQLGQTVTQIGVVVDVFKDVATAIRNIKDLLVETQNFRQEFLNAKAQIKDVENAVESVKRQVNSNLTILQNQINSIATSNVNTNNKIVDQVNSLQNKLSNTNNAINNNQASLVNLKNSAMNYVNELITEINNSNNDVSKIKNAVINLQNKLGNL
jgi:hypothetical protein